MASFDNPLESNPRIVSCYPAPPYEAFASSTMRGISGIYTSGAPVEVDALQDMACRLVHPVSNNPVLFLCGRLGLAQTQRSITDLSGSHQPIIDEASGLTLAANGAIFNDVDLTSRLTRLGRRLAINSNHEIILQAYAGFGLDFLRHLNGIFAFALYDKPHERLILARDRLGIKPLYWLRLPDRVLFGSEIKALLPYIPSPQLAPEALAQYLACDCSFGQKTLVNGIHRVLPGQALIVERNLNIQVLDYYWPDLVIVPRQDTYEDLAAEFDALIDQVMREHQRTNLPFGLFLSGGLDSSVLLALIASRQTRPVRTFSVGFTDVDVVSEIPAIEASVRRYSSDHTSIILSREALFSRVPYMIWAADDLVLDYAMLPVSWLAQAASQEVKVVFTGDGGDEVFAGNGYYRYPALLRALRALLVPGSGGYRVQTNWPLWQSQRVYSAPLFSMRKSAASTIGSMWRRMRPDWTFLTQRQVIDLQTFSAESLAPKVSGQPMAFDVEGRVPLLDYRIVEFGLALPDSLKIAPHQGKVFLRRWARRFYPAGYLDRPKCGFSVPMQGIWAGKRLDELGLRLRKNYAIREWFNVAGIDWLIQRQRTTGRMTRQLWALVQIALWHRIFIEDGGSAPPLEANLLDWVV